MNKKALSERDICTKFITPAIERAQWDVMTQVREEVGLTVRSVFASYLIRVAPLNPMNPRYLKAFTASGLYWRQLYAGAAGTGQPNVNATTLKRLLVPIPPVDEQRAIVAKVDQLMAICDDLEGKLRRAEDRAAKLVEVVVQELVA